MKSIILGMAFLLFLSACTATPEPPLMTIKEPLEEIQPALEEEHEAGSLWQVHNSSMFSDRKAMEVGDIVTVIISEQASASKEAKTSSSRTSNMSASIPNFFGLENAEQLTSLHNPIDLENLDIEGRAGFGKRRQGRGDHDRRDVLHLDVVDVVRVDGNPVTGHHVVDRLQIEMPNGNTGYTRSGALKRDSNGRLTNSDGYPILPAITIPDGARQITIGETGIVSAIIGDDTAATEIGTLELATFTNNAGLSAIGKNLFEETAASGTAQTGTPGADGYGSLLQTYLEGSNVNIVEELASMITTQRAYEINSKTIQTSDEMMQTTNNLI